MFWSLIVSTISAAMSRGATQYFEARSEVHRFRRRPERRVLLPCLGTVQRRKDEVFGAEGELLQREEGFRLLTGAFLCSLCRCAPHPSGRGGRRNGEGDHEREHGDPRDGEHLSARQPDELLQPAPDFPA